WSGSRLSVVAVAYPCARDHGARLVIPRNNGGRAGLLEHGSWRTTRARAARLGQLPVRGDHQEGEAVRALRGRARPGLHAALLEGMGLRRLAGDLRLRPTSPGPATH